MSGFQLRLAALETGAAGLSDQAGVIASRDATIKDLEGKLDKASKDLTAANEKVTSLTTEAATAKGLVNKALASQGLPADQLPAAEAPASGAVQHSAWDQYQSLLSKNPREAGAYWQANADKILASKK